MVGNSSSGLLEAPSFGIGTINIGERQAGRLMATSVINCGSSYQEISLAMDRLFNDEFKRSLVGVKNPYGDGGACQRLVKIFRQLPHRVSLSQSFIDLDFSLPE